jgi:hypothetical protein
VEEEPLVPVAALDEAVVAVLDGSDHTGLLGNLGRGREKNKISPTNGFSLP